MFISFSAPKSIKQFALDEADEMLSRGFKDQIYEIFQKLATDTQVILCFYFYFFVPTKVPLLPALCAVMGVINFGREM